MRRRGVEEKKKYRKGERNKNGMSRWRGLFKSAPCLILLTSLALVAVAAMFGVCKVLCRCDFPFYERRKKTSFPPPPSPPPLPNLPPAFMRGGGGKGRGGGGSEVAGATPRYIFG